MKLIDLHCDTTYHMHSKCGLLAKNNFHISLDKAAMYENYAQIMAIFVSPKCSDEDGYRRFHEVYGYFCSQAATNADKVMRVSDGQKIDMLWQDNKYPLFLSVEDARILNNDITRLDNLYKKGVRFLVLMWSGETCVGGSHNTETGLTDFGRQVMARCFELGIIPDVSHASEQTADEMIGMARDAGMTIMASHSNSHAVYGHTRNLRDRHFTAIKSLNGIVGISLCRSHLAPGEKCDISAVMRHIDHYMSIGGENTVALGCDLDGTNLPDDFKDMRDLDKIADIMSKSGYSDITIEKIFWRNAKRFLETYIK